MNKSTCKEDGQMQYLQAFTFSLDSFQKRPWNILETCFGFPMFPPLRYCPSYCPKNKELHSDRSVIQLQKVLILLDFKTCWSVFPRLCGPQPWAIPGECLLFCQGSPPANRENNQFLGLNVYDWPIPSMFWKKETNFDGERELVPRCFTLVYLLFLWASGEVLVIFIFEFGHRPRMETLEVISISLQWRDCSTQSLWSNHFDLRIIALRWRQITYFIWQMTYFERYQNLRKGRIRTSRKIQASFLFHFLQSILL